MKRLIVPCAGRKFINNKPKYLNRHPQGQILAKKTLEGMPLSIIDEIIYIILAKDIIEYDAENILKTELSEIKNLRIVVLEDETEGPAETVYLAIKKLAIDGEIIIKDLDNKVEIENVIENKNFVVGLDLKRYEDDVYQLNKKSFVIVNEQNNVMSIEEKRICSEMICVGVYGFRNAKEFCFAYERLQSASNMIKNLYISHIISYLVGYSQRIFMCYKTEKYESWGSEKEWSDVQAQYATYYLNFDNIWMCGEKKQDEIKKLLKASQRGAKFVCVSCFSREKVEISYKEMLEAGINSAGLVCDCLHSEKKYIIDSLGDVNKLL